jgi:hypothetical protein
MDGVESFCCNIGLFFLLFPQDSNEYIYQISEIVYSINEEVSYLSSMLVGRVSGYCL